MTGINWNDLQVLTHTGINWANLGSYIDTLSEAGINWSDLAVMTRIGINWHDLSVMTKIGINWNDYGSFNAKQGVNWYYFQLNQQVLTGNDFGCAQFYQCQLE